MTQQTAMRTTRQRPGRRAKLRKSIVLLTLMAIGLLLFMAWRRDSHHVGERIAELERFRQALQAEYDRLGQLPAKLPRIERGSARRSTYAYMDDATRYYLQRAEGPVVVMSTNRVELILGEDWRGVIVMHEGKLSVESMTELEFARFWREQRAAVEKMPSVDASPN